MPLEVNIVLVFLLFAGLLAAGLVPIYRFMQKQDLENEKWTKENIARIRAQQLEKRRLEAETKAQSMPPADDVDVKPSGE